MIIVPPYGPTSADIYIAGEGPGRQEAEARPPRPFVGVSGQEQAGWLWRYGIDVRDCRLANVIQEYTPGNPDPTPEQIARWSPVLAADILSCSPRLIVAVGRFAARWFLGESANLDIVHGMPYRAGAFDPSRADRAPAGTLIVPAYHPSFGLRADDPTSMARAHVASDYEQVGWVWSRIAAGETVQPIADEYPDAEYLDVTGERLAGLLRDWSEDQFDGGWPYEIGLDTEGVPGCEWSVQVSVRPGSGYVLRTAQPDFHVGIAALQSLVDSGVTVVTHQASTPSGAMYDTRMCRGMGLELRRARIWDTMYALYLLRLESLSLKVAGPRWCGMAMSDYESLLGDLSRERQIEYLDRVVSAKWPRAERRLIEKNDGTARLYRPDPIERTAEKLLIAALTGQTEKDGSPLKIDRRWRDIDREARRPVEEELGPLPEATLDDVPLAEATVYAAKDADATLRLKPKLLARLYQLSASLPTSTHLGTLADRASEGSSLLRVIEEMQHEGMPASRPHFQQLRDFLHQEVGALQSQLSSRFFGGLPFNPKSPPQTNTLLRRNGLQPLKKTETGAWSTAKKSIEHLKTEHEAVQLLFDWRERQHLRDSFCANVLAQIPPEADIWPVRAPLNACKIPTRRLAAAKSKSGDTEANLLAIPVRTEIGRRVRACYRLPDQSTYADPSEALVFVAVDLSQIELRVIAHISGDETLCRVFHEGRDPHRETAARVWNLPLVFDPVTRKYDKTLSGVDDFLHRLPAKTVIFGMIYGQQEQGLQEQLRSLGLQGWDKARCRDLRREVFALYPQMARYIEAVTGDVSRSPRDTASASGQACSGLVWDLWGMRRYVPHAVPKPAVSGRGGRGARRFDREEQRLQAQAARESVNHTVQGTAQGMLQRSMIWLDDRILELRDAGLPVHWRLTIHDEVILTCPEWYAESLAELVVEGLTEHCGVELSVPVLAEAKRGRAWSELK